MKKQQTPTMKVVITREVDGKVLGARAWSMTVSETDADKFEDALTYLCNAAMNSIPNTLPAFGPVVSDKP